MGFLIVETAAVSDVLEDLVTVTKSWTTDAATGRMCRQHTYQVKRSIDTISFAPTNRYFSIFKGRVIIITPTGEGSFSIGFQREVDLLTYSDPKSGASKRTRQDN